jgi:hypothetical protein
MLASKHKKAMKNLTVEIADYQRIKKAKALKDVWEKINIDRDFQFKKYHKLFTGLDPVDSDDPQITIESMVKAVNFINKNLDLIEGENEENATAVEFLIDNLQDERFRNTLISILKSMLHRFRYSEKEQSKKLFLIS